MGFMSFILDDAEFNTKIGLIAAIGEDSRIDGALMEGGKIIETSCKSFCPVDTGRLRSSIQAAQEGSKMVTVAPHTDYAAYVEFGTYKMAAQPYMHPGYEAAREQALEHIRAKLGEGASITI